ncbi:hypothetical protein GW17_00028642 [Ensete ventricosum]|nr:hypothetical protein GW17_00028642 [Ensete ventricosum]RZS01736.1 hypothetical protein BHM03_00031655 [Ensete ventricosum]
MLIGIQFACFVVDFTHIKTFAVPELQGEPEEISIEKARLAATSVLWCLLMLLISKVLMVFLSSNLVDMIFKWMTRKWFLLKIGHEGFRIL